VKRNPHTLALILAFVLIAELAVAGSPPSAFVRVSPRDPRYLELTDGTPYIPIGLNMIIPPRGETDEAEALRGMEAWLASLSANGGNYIRVWISSRFWDIEHDKSGVYDESKARRIDRLLELCEKHNVRVKLTLEHFRSIEGADRWVKRLHHVSNGGPAKSTADFFDGEAPRAQFKNKIRWYGDRYGSRPVVYGWELWNEVNAVRVGDDYRRRWSSIMTWTGLMLAELHKTFPRNLGMQSLGTLDNERVRELYQRNSTLPGNDVAQVHRYLDLGASLEVCKGPVDVLAADAIRELRSYDSGRPIILAESGAVEPKHTGPFALYKADREGTLLHDVLFAPFFAGAAGPGQIWHWDAYVAANNLWWQFGRFAEAVRGLDPPAEAFEPTMLEHDRLRIYALKGRRTLLAWCRDKASNWEAELKNGEKPGVLRDLRVDLRPVLAGRQARRLRVYDPWSGKWSEAKLRNGAIELPPFSRSIVIKAI